ncbi:MAG: hypothetical protein FWD88_06295 [Treponema sp.]|nr:hypothetical protein [Treponema sp.]
MALKLRKGALEPAVRGIDLLDMALGVPGQSLDSVPSNVVTFTVAAVPQPLAAPQITLVGSVVFWAGVSGAGGYSVRVNGNHVALG